MNMLIRVPQPCQEDWRQMPPEEQGRYCNVCCKTVIDFTGWHPQEILFYLKANAGACGRFRQDQLDVPVPAPENFIMHLQQALLPVKKKIAAIILFVFFITAASCSNKAEKLPPPEVRYTTGIPAIEVPQSVIDSSPVTKQKKPARLKHRHQHLKNKVRQTPAAGNAAE